MNARLIKNITICALMTIFIPFCICGCSEKNKINAAPAAEASLPADERNSSSAQQSHSESSSSESSAVSEPRGSESAETNGSAGSRIDSLFAENPYYNEYKENKDSDGDGLTDSDEAVLGLDPRNPRTFGTPDAEYKVKQTIPADSEALRQVNTKDSPYTLSLEVTAAGNVNSSLTAGKSSYSSVIDNSDTQLGNSIDLKYFGGEVGEVTLHFTIGGEYLENELNVFPDEKELQGVRRFNVFKYFEDINMLLPIETTIDEETNTISTTVDELGTYCVVDMEKWFYNLMEFVGETSGEANIGTGGQSL